MARIHQDIRQYIKHSISRAEEKEVPEARPTTEPTETDKTSKQNENHEPTLRGINSNKTSIIKAQSCTPQNLYLKENQDSEMLHKVNKHCQS